jgi:two-component system chemotaxis sensor kinase CheA
LALERLIDPSSDGEAAAESGDIEGLDFTPVAFDSFDFGNTPAESELVIAIAPRSAMIGVGIDPAPVLGLLRLMGEASIVAETAALPTLEALRVDEAYLGWTITLRTSASHDDILQVLAPIADHCEIRIECPTSEAVIDPVAAFAAEPPALVDESASSFAPLDLPFASAPALAPVSPEGMPVADATPVKKPVHAPVPSVEPAQATASAKAPAGGTIRVELEKIDRVVNMVGELVIAQAMFAQILETLPEESSSRVTEVLNDLVRHTRGLKDSVMAIRAQPVSSVFQRMPRLVRELAVKTGKKVQVETSGETTEVDKTIIERLSDPLTHIIRNSIDHGIEAPEQRLAKGKPEMGTIRLSADQRGGRIVIEISDDGAGINCERVLRKAIDRGLVDANAKLTDDEICNLIFLPGFSTAETVSDISGRGVGMDVVRRNIQDLGGRTSIKSDSGRGMTIQLLLPLTLAVMDGMVVEVSKQTYVLPIPNVVECLRPKSEEVHHLLGTAGTLQLRGEIVPLIWLGDLLGMPDTRGEIAARIVIIVEASDGTRLGLIVDELCGHQQVVIKSIEENCGLVRGIAGATILGDGHVSFILDVEALSDMASGAAAYAPQPVAA